MKIHSVSAVFVLAVIASGAMAGETVRVAAQESAPLPANPANPAHQALGVPTQALTDIDVARLARSAMAMPACSTCH